ncbi:probable basic-leucine zipper transcription factor S [Ctenocephalides felis]|uniref:probable basic-leucine zipper transcription factor S n=1 Tax=Ctenocephalides felis TaxID=7515 RepID=UPI000E6E35D7|nr:probable basic-leucine zipper transcription factor S [Ctenocephalides felis]
MKQEFNNEPGSATHTVNAESPFPIFRPLNQNQTSQNGSGENQSEVTPLKHPDSPVLPHNNIESSNSGLVSQISNENNHLMIDEPIVSPEHAVNIEAPRPVVDNIASIRSNMQIISNAIINIVTNDHMENDNNNGPISELDIQNIANNNAEGYIQNQNELFLNQNLNVVSENYQNAGSAFINFNQNFVDLSSVPSTSGATNQISNDDQTTKSFGDSSNAGVVQSVINLRMIGFRKCRCRRRCQ